MTVIRKKIGAVFFIIAALVLFGFNCLCSAASAEGTVTMTIVCEERGKSVKGMSWSVFRIGSYDGEKIDLEGEFTKYPVDMSDLSSSGLADAASTLKAYAFTYKVEPNGKGTTQSDGTVTFDGLEDGVYLVAANKSKAGDITYIPAPAIVFIDPEQNVDFTVYPKITSIRTLADEFERLSLRKIWEKYDGMIEKPTEIVVDIYRDYELYETVTLSADKDWNYSWEELTGSEWTMIERNIPEKCTIVYRNDGRRYIVVNTYNPEFIFDWDTDHRNPPDSTTTTATGAVLDEVETNTTAAESFSTNKADETTETDKTYETTASVDTSASTAVNDKTPDNTVKHSNTPTLTTTAENKLPQTGQLWWPVPVMTMIGLILIAVGTKIIFECTRKDNE